MGMMVFAHEKGQTTISPLAKATEVRMKDRGKYIGLLRCLLEDMAEKDVNDEFGKAVMEGKHFIYVLGAGGPDNRVAQMVAYDPRSDVRVNVSEEAFAKFDMVVGLRYSPA